MRLEFHSRYVNLLVGDTHKLLGGHDDQEYVSNTGGNFEPVRPDDELEYEEEPDMRFGFCSTGDK